MRTRSLGVIAGLAMVGAAMIGGSGNYASAGLDPTTCFDKTVTISASDGVVRGTSGSDVIYVPEYTNAKVYGNGGNDFICSASFSATIYGGAGNDHIDGFGTLYGDAGNDTITSDGYIQEKSAIVVYGGAGNDDIDVDDAEYVDGGSGDDDIHVHDTSVTRGGSGNDDMQVHDSGDAFSDSGDDWIEMDDSDDVDCGAGRDFLVDVDESSDSIRRCETVEVWEP